MSIYRQQLGEFGIAFCKDGDTAIALLGRVLDQARAVGVDQAHPSFVSAKDWHAQESGFSTSTWVTLPGTGGCESIVQIANGHINSVNALIAAAKPAAPQYRPGAEPPKGPLENLFKWAITGAVVIAGAYAFGPLLRSIAVGGKSTPARKFAGYRR